ncbi:Sap, sulfolipid-1-addressing protein [Micrococcales bacterium KH10]|nr:Sap, sulfolipid-1-addressing protein [Micrococcales bacterium KH10]
MSQSISCLHGPLGSSDFSGCTSTLAIAYFVLGVVLMLGVGAVLTEIDPTVRMWVQGGIGAAMFVGSWFIPAKKKEEHVSPRPRESTVRAMIMLGIGTWLFEFYTAVPYFAAIGIMTSAGLQPPEWLLLLSAYALVMILPAVVLLLAQALMRERMQGRLEHWQRKLETGSRTALSWIVGIAGALLFLDALPNEIIITTK